MRTAAQRAGLEGPVRLEAVRARNGRPCPMLLQRSATHSRALFSWSLPANAMPVFSPIPWTPQSRVKCLRGLFAWRLPASAMQASSPMPIILQSNVKDLRALLVWRLSASAMPALLLVAAGNPGAGALAQVCRPRYNSAFASVSTLLQSQDLFKACKRRPIYIRPTTTQLPWPANTSPRLIRG